MTDTLISDLDLPVRIQNRLRRQRIVRVSDLISRETELRTNLNSDFQVLLAFMREQGYWK